MGKAEHDALLSIAEAADRFGVNRLRIREAIAAGKLKALRDNKGNLRVHLDGPVDLSIAATDTVAATPEALMELLFDEVEELQGELKARDATIERMAELLERQQNAAEHAAAIAEGKTAESIQTEALTETTGRALDLLDDAVQKLGRNSQNVRDLADVMERTFTASSKLEEKIAERDAVIEHQTGMINRLFSLAENGLGLASDPGADQRGLLQRLLGRKKPGR